MAALTFCMCMGTAVLALSVGLGHISINVPLDMCGAPLFWPELAILEKDWLVQRRTYVWT